MGYNKRLATPQKQAGGWTNYSEAVRPFIEAWTDKMVEIWGDRMEQMNIHDTGALSSSLEEGSVSFGDEQIDATFKFLLSGIYVDLGTGNGYTRGNPGDLRILDPAYRLEHGLTNMRKRRPWFNTPWYISVQVMKEKLASIAGDHFVGLFDTLNERERK